MRAAVQMPRFDHLRRLTEGCGVYEHCRGDEPRRELGYCTDDAARALVLACWVGDEVADLRETYLRFVIDAVAPDGSCPAALGDAAPATRRRRSISSRSR